MTDEQMVWLLRSFAEDDARKLFDSLRGLRSDPGTGFDAALVELERRWRSRGKALAESRELMLQAQQALVSAKAAFGPGAPRWLRDTISNVIAALSEELKP